MAKAKEASIRVEYIGKKPFAIDNVSGSGKSWEGPGDVQVVTEEQAEKLASYADQWRIVGEAGAKTNESAVAALKELGADPTVSTPAADVAQAAAAAAASAARGSRKPAGKKPTVSTPAAEEAFKD